MSTESGSSGTTGGPRKGSSPVGEGASPGAAGTGGLMPSTCSGRTSIDVAPGAVGVDSVVWKAESCTPGSRRVDRAWGFKAPEVVSGLSDAGGAGALAPLELGVNSSEGTPEFSIGSGISPPGARRPGASSAGRPGVLSGVGIGGGVSAPNGGVADVAGVGGGADGRGGAGGASSRSSACSSRYGRSRRQESSMAMYPVPSAGTSSRWCGHCGTGERASAARSSGGAGGRSGS